MHECNRIHLGQVLPPTSGGLAKAFPVLWQVFTTFSLTPESRFELRSLGY